MRYKTICTVMKVEERFRQRHVHGMGAEATYTSESRGWWATLPGNFSMQLGVEQPPFRAGQMAYLILDVPDDV